MPISSMSFSESELNSSVMMKRSSSSSSYMAFPFVQCRCEAGSPAFMSQVWRI